MPPRPEASRQSEVSSDRTWYAEKRKVIRIGDSVGVTLPKTAARDAGVIDAEGAINDDVVVELFREDGVLGAHVRVDTE